MAESRVVIDLFSGPRGWDVAADALGLDPLGVEFDDAAVATSNAAGFRTLQADVAALDPRDVLMLASATELEALESLLREPEGRAVLERAYKEQGEPGLWGLIASPPCQAFSMAGGGHGRRALSAYEEAIERWLEGKPPSRDELDEACEDERGHLVLEPLRWALALRPTWIACEQVEPVLPLWEAMGAGLARTGYSTWTGVLSSEQYGVPQTRKRAIMLARRDGIKAQRPPATHQRYLPREKKFKEETTMGLFEDAPGRRVAPEDRGLLPWVSMAQALGWESPSVPIDGQRRSSGPGASRTPRKLTEPSYTLRANAGGGSEGVGRSGGVEWVGDGAWAPDDQVGFPRLNDVEGDDGEYRERDLRPASEPAFALTEKARSWTRFVANSRANATERSVDEPAPTIDEPAPTIAGESRNDSWVNERPATTVNGDPRISEPGHHDSDVSGSQQANAIRVSVEEAAALQSFPANYPWAGTRTKVFEQIGNAVPPLMALAILKEVTRALSAEPAGREAVSADDLSEAIG